MPCRCVGAYAIIIMLSYMCCYVSYILYYSYTCALYTLSHSTIYIMYASDNLAVALKNYSKKRGPDTKALGKICVYIVHVYIMYTYFIFVKCMYT